MDEVLQFRVTEELANLRLDLLVSRLLGAAHVDKTSPTAATRSQVAQWIRDGRVLVDSKVVTRTSEKVGAKSAIEIRVPAPRMSELAPDPSVKLDIIFEDTDVLVLNKPAGMVVHPGAGNWSGTLVNGLVAHLGDSIQQVGNARRPGLVHRLDRDTTGLMVVAKTDLAYRHLLSQFVPPRKVVREYLALTLYLPKTSSTSSRTPGLPEGEEAGVIDARIERHQKDRKRMAVSRERGRDARTEWRVQERLDYGFVLALRLDTGRTHQIRVHLKAHGSPIVGDPTYGSPIQDFPRSLQTSIRKFGRQALHAFRLSFVHPTTGELQQFQADPPEDLRLLIELFRRGKSP